MDKKNKENETIFTSCFDPVMIQNYISVRKYVVRLVLIHISLETPMQHYKGEGGGLGISNLIIFMT